MREYLWLSPVFCRCSCEVEDDVNVESIKMDCFEAGKKHELENENSVVSELGRESLCPTADVKLDPENNRLENNLVIHWVSSLMLLKILKIRFNWFLM